MTDKIRAALEEYTQTPFMSAMGEALNQCCRTLASEGHADDCRGIEALREYDARATPALPQGDEYKHAKCPGHDAYAASQALPQGVEEWIAENGLQMEETLGGFGEQIMQSKLCKYPCPDYIREDDLRAYLSGMAIVPVEPTEEMYEAASAIEFYGPGLQMCEMSEALTKILWQAMLAAAKEKGE